MKRVLILGLGFVHLSSADWQQVGSCQVSQPTGCKNCTGALKGGSAGVLGCKAFGGVENMNLASCVLLAEGASSACDDRGDDRGACIQIAEKCSSDNCNWFDHQEHDGCGDITQYCRPYACRTPPTLSDVDGDQSYTGYSASNAPPPPDPSLEPLPFYDPLVAYCISKKHEIPSIGGCMPMEEAKKVCSQYFDPTTNTRCAGHWYINRTCIPQTRQTFVNQGWSRVGKDCEDSTNPKTGDTCKKCAGVPYTSEAVKQVGGFDLDPFDDDTNCTDIATGSWPISNCDKLKTDPFKAACKLVVGVCRDPSACNVVTIWQSPSCQPDRGPHYKFCRFYNATSTPSLDGGCDDPQGCQGAFYTLMATALPPSVPSYSFHFSSVFDSSTVVPAKSSDKYCPLPSSPSQVSISLGGSENPPLNVPAAVQMVFGYSPGHKVAVDPQKGTLKGIYSKGATQCNDDPQCLGYTWPQNRVWNALQNRFPKADVVFEFSSSSKDGDHMPPEPGFNSWFKNTKYLPQRGVTFII